MMITIIRDAVGWLITTVRNRAISAGRQVSSTIRSVPA